MVDAYFQRNNNTKKIMLDWAAIHFLALGRYYENGDLNNSKMKKNETIEELNLNGMNFNIVEDFLDIQMEGHQKKIPTKIFIGYKDNIEYRISVLEIIRAVITRSRFLLNRIVELDSLNKYFIYHYDNNDNLYIDFFDEYERKLLKPEYVKHLAWIISNDNILKMFHKVGQNLWLKEDIEFPILFKEFKIKARIKKKKNFVRILEILEFRGEEVNARNVFYRSKYNKKYRKIHLPKKRKYERPKENSDKILDPTIDGSKNSQSDFINTFKVKHFYGKDCKVTKVIDGECLVRDDEDENTRIYDVENEALRTTADVGGLKRAKGLEYQTVEDIYVTGELEEFVEILKRLKEKPNIKDIKIVISDLPKGKRGKKFAKLQDGETNRRYAVGKLIMNNGIEVNLIEVEREEKSLSMLVLYSKESVVWHNIYFKVALGLVNNNGTWNSKVLEKFKLKGIVSKRIRHKSIKSSIKDKVDHIYEKISKVC